MQFIEIRMFRIKELLVAPVALIAEKSGKALGKSV